MHLFVDISDHGLGHLAIVAPVLDAIADFRPRPALTIRSGLPVEALRRRIAVPFRHIAGASDFGYRMIDAIRIDLAASAREYRDAHAGWDRRVATEASLLRGIRPDLVLSSVSALPLAGAARAGIRCAAICSLNWADLLSHFFAREPWATSVHADLLAAYRGADRFVRPTPSMPMPALANTVDVGPIARMGTRRALGLPTGARAVLVAMGGIAHRLPVERWARTPGVTWFVPSEWRCTHPDAIDWQDAGLSFTDLLASVDAVLTKPGYGTFAEAACNGTPVLWQRREDWPEQDCLVAWIGAQGRALEVDGPALEDRPPLDALDHLLSRPVPDRPVPDRPVPDRPVPTGARQAAELLCALVDSR